MILCLSCLDGILIVKLLTRVDFIINPRSLQYRNTYGRDKD